MKFRCVSFVLFSLMVFSDLSIAGLVLAQTYGYCYVVTYGTDLVDDTVNGILSFNVTSNGNGTSIIVQIWDGGFQQYLEILETGDIVLIDYKDCNVTYKSIQEVSPDEYLIGFTGEANSVTINATEIPEFFSLVVLPVFILATLLVAILHKRKAARLSSHKPQRAKCWVSMQSVRS